MVFKLTMAGKMIILYGSQTGTAQDISENIWRESKRFHFKGAVKPMDDYNVTELIEEEIAIFVCSTTGQGGEKGRFTTVMHHICLALL